MYFPPIIITAQLCQSSDPHLNLMPGTNVVYQVRERDKKQLTSHPLFPLQDGSALGEAANVSAAEDELHARYCWTIGSGPGMPARELPCIVGWKRVEADEWEAEPFGQTVQEWHLLWGLCVALSRGEWGAVSFVLTTRSTQMCCSGNERQLVSTTGGGWNQPQVWLLTCMKPQDWGHKKSDAGIYWTNEALTICFPF